ncbi:MAG: DUF3750 domain-containing protein [Candidatus Taylorbacteria bacterium]|nr:DUF3750 domain-containing protein [Candidatus Taylorbacteria bacterium]
MNTAQNNLINPEKYEVFVLYCHANIPFSLAIHPWLVCNEKGKISRWEVLFRKNRDKTLGHLHLNHYLPFTGIEIIPFVTKWQWQSKILSKIEGEVAKRIIDFIKTSKKNYPYIKKYLLISTNSNTYVQWVLNNFFPEVNIKLPWNAFGKNIK